MKKVKYKPAGQQRTGNTAKIIGGSAGQDSAAEKMYLIAV